MLVLSRKTGQRIVVPTLGITVEVLQIRGDSVRIGIEAPREIPVHRQEVVEKMAAEKTAQAVAGPEQSVFQVPVH